MAKKLIIVLTLVLVISALTFFGIKFVKAEQSGGSPESGVTSRIKTTYNAIVALSQGSDAAGGWGNWGAYWNRIRSATGLLPHGCSTQQYHDSYGAPVTETTNCSLTWTANPTPVTGDDARSGRGSLDPRTGLTWSQLLLNNAGTVVFSPTTNSTWNWDGTLKFTVTSATAAVGDTYTNNGQTFTVAYAISGATTLYATATGNPAASGNLVRTSGSGTDPIVFSAYTLYGSNVAVGSKTASQLCSERNGGGVWRLPTEKELLQAYIDGSYWNLTQPSYNFWSVTETSSTNAWLVYLNNGYTSNYVKSTFSSQVRCIR